MTHKDRTIRITPDYSIENLKARRTWIDVLQTLKKLDRLQYPPKLQITRKKFHNKTKFKQHVLSISPALQKTLEKLST